MANPTINAQSNTQSNGSGQYYSANQINYAAIDKLVTLLEFQINDILNRWPIVFQVGNVVIKKSATNPTNYATSSSSFSTASNYNNTKLPNVVINGSVPSNVYLNFTFMEPLQGDQGPKGIDGIQGDPGKVGLTGPPGPSGYWGNKYI